MGLYTADIESIIKTLRESDKNIEIIFTQGGCYQFHLFLKSLYPNAKPMLSQDGGHVVSLIYRFIEKPKLVTESFKGPVSIGHGKPGYFRTKHNAFSLIWG